MLALALPAVFVSDGLDELSGRERAAARAALYTGRVALDHLLERLLTRRMRVEREADHAAGCGALYEAEPFPEYGFVVTTYTAFAIRYRRFAVCGGSLYELG